MIRHLNGIEYPYPMLVEQPEQQTFRANRGIYQLCRLHGGKQRKRFLPRVVDRFGSKFSAIAITARNVGYAHALRSLRQKLRQQPASTPPLMSARLDQLCNREPQIGRDLLRLPEIDARSLFERSSIELDDALITLCVGAQGDGQQEPAEAAFAFFDDRNTFIVKYKIKLILH